MPKRRAEQRRYISANARSSRKAVRASSRSSVSLSSAVVFIQPAHRHGRFSSSSAADVTSLALVERLGTSILPEWIAPIKTQLRCHRVAAQRDGAATFAPVSWGCLGVRTCSERVKSFGSSAAFVDQIVGLTVVQL